MIIATAMLLALAQPPKTVEKPADADEVAVIRQRLEKSLRAAEAKLGKSEPGKPTQELQKSIIGDLDQLIKLLQNPPPQNQQPQDQPPGDSPDKSDGQPSNASGGPPGGQRSDQPSSSRSPSGGNRRDRKGNRPPSNDMARGGERSPSDSRNQNANNRPNDRGPQPGDAAGNPGANPDKANGAVMPNIESGKPEKLADMSRDVWGHLPETLRQEVDHYYRERFMPKYRELLRQYYTKLAEADRKNDRKK